MRRLAWTIFILLMAMPLATAVATDENTGTKNRDQDVVAQPTDGALPVMAKNQRRPASIRVAAEDCVDPDCPLNLGDDGDGGYTAGACNCYRICFLGNSGCNLSTSRVGCKSGEYYPNPCSSCSNSCI